MVGTQMVAKGLDFEDVTLVGVLGIDSLLFAQGFRAYENGVQPHHPGGGPQLAVRKTPALPSSRPPTPTTRCSTLPPHRTTTPFSSRRSRTGNWACTRPSAGCASSASAGPKEIEVARAAARFSALLRPSGGKAARPAPPGAGPHARQHRKDQRQLPLQAHRQVPRRPTLPRPCAPVRSDCYEQEKLPSKATVVVDLHSDGDI